MNESTFAIIVLLDFFLILIDLLTIKALRRFLKDFVRVKRNKKAAAKIHLGRTEREKLTLNYVREHAGHREKQFNFYQKIYYITLITIVPQYIIIIMSNVFMAGKSIVILWFFAAIKLTIWYASRPRQ